MTGVGGFIRGRSGALALMAHVALMALMALASPALAQRANSPIIPGGNSRAPISIDAGKLDFFDKEQKLVYSGGVIARQGDASLKAATLTIFFVKDGGGEGEARNRAAAGASISGGDNQVRRMEAAGPVTIVNKQQVGTGDRGVYDRVDNKVYLIGNPTLTEGSHVVQGDAQSQLIYDLTAGRAQIVGGRVRSLITPSSAAQTPSPAAQPPSPAQPGEKPRPAR